MISETYIDAVNGSEKRFHLIGQIWCVPVNKINVKHSAGYPMAMFHKKRPMQ